MCSVQQPSCDFKAGMTLFAAGIAAALIASHGWAGRAILAKSADGDRDVSREQEVFMRTSYFFKRMASENTALAVLQTDLLNVYAALASRPASPGFHRLNVLVMAATVMAAIATAVPTNRSLGPVLYAALSRSQAPEHFAAAILRAASQSEPPNRSCEAPNSVGVPGAVSTLCTMLKALYFADCSMRARCSTQQEQVPEPEPDATAGAGADTAARAATQGAGAVGGFASAAARASEPAAQDTAAVARPSASAEGPAARAGGESLQPLLQGPCLQCFLVWVLSCARECSALQLPAGSSTQQQEQPAVPCYSLRCALDAGLLGAVERTLRQPDVLLQPESCRYMPHAVRVLAAVQQLLCSSGVWPAALAHGPLAQVAGLVASLARVTAALANVAVGYQRLLGSLAVGLWAGYIAHTAANIICGVPEGPLPSDACAALRVLLPPITRVLVQACMSHRLAVAADVRLRNVRQALVGVQKEGGGGTDAETAALQELQQLEEEAEQAAAVARSWAELRGRLEMRVLGLLMLSSARAVAQSGDRRLQAMWLRLLAVWWSQGSLEALDGTTSSSSSQHNDGGGCSRARADELPVDTVTPELVSMARAHGWPELADFVSHGPVVMRRVLGDAVLQPGTKAEALAAAVAGKHEEWVDGMEPVMRKLWVSMTGADWFTGLAAQQTWLLPRVEPCCHPTNGDAPPRAVGGGGGRGGGTGVGHQINFKQLLNFDGIYVADRYAAGGPVFVPSPANTPWLPFPHQMSGQQAAAALRPGGELAWTQYMGNWGVPLTSPNFSMTCLTHHLTHAGPCDPRNPPVFILDRLLGGVAADPRHITWTPSGWLSYCYGTVGDTSSLACPLTEDAHRTGLGGLAADPRVGRRLRAFVAAATVAIVAAAALSALVVKGCRGGAVWLLCRLPTALCCFWRRGGKGGPADEGLLQTLHALRNLLLRGLWAIAGLEGVFVGLLAVGGVVELTAMVAAVCMQPKVAAALHLLGFGLALWVGVLGASEGCSAAVQVLYRVISFSPDVCLDLSVIGVPGPRHVRSGSGAGTGGSLPTLGLEIRDRVVGFGGVHTGTERTPFGARLENITRQQ
eukprot:XP_001701256.1 predicted protein [Chlamydomonas reinhardtii]